MENSIATITLELAGTKPLLMHNGRLANPLDPWTRELKALTAKRKKTDEDLMAIMRVEARGGIYETHDGCVGLPAVNVWTCVYEAAKAFKRGVDIKRAVACDMSLTVPLLVDGDPLKVDDFLSNPENIDYRPVRVQTSKTMRSRPIVVRDWSATVEFDVLTDVIDLRDLEPIVERAGRLVGLCEYRPLMGTFVATVNHE